MSYEMKEVLGSLGMAVAASVLIIGPLLLAYWYL